MAWLLLFSIIAGIVLLQAHRWLREAWLQRRLARYEQWRAAEPPRPAPTSRSVAGPGVWRWRGRESVRT